MNTTGIAIIIFASQIRDLLGLTLPGKEPAALIPKLQALPAAQGTLNPAALGLSVFGLVSLVERIFTGRTREVVA